MSVNLTVLQGRVGQDIDLKYTQSSRPVVNFGLAVVNGFGETKSTHWINIVAWGKLAEQASENLKKGVMTTVTGRLQTRKFKDREGNEKTVVEVVASSIGFPEVYEVVEKSGNRTEKPDEDENIGF